jgi:hypothetical protein
MFYRFFFGLCCLMFLAEASLNLMLDWDHGLSWLNPLLAGMGCLGAMGSNRRSYGVAAIAAAVVIQGYRLTRF